MKNLDVHKLEVLDSEGGRQFVIPAEVKGFFTQKKRVVHSILLLLFLALPWIRINGQQLLHLDIEHRRFFVFGLNLAAHDTPLIFLFLIIATLGLAYVTAIWGRVWCGWACPQTVFIEHVYRKIEQLIEGNHIARRALRDQALNLNKTAKLFAKWFLYVAVSSLIAHSLAAYFVGRDELLNMISAGPAQNSTYFILITGLTFLLVFNFGWFREQFCLIVCPYGRIQSLLMDPNSLTILYDDKRGEPRKGTTRGSQQQGDCVSCFRCVAVCPTRIDIRNGQQMECIGCTACIDACDEIMQKVNKPKGLIRYDSLSRKHHSALRGRPLIYMVGILGAMGALLYLLTQRSSLDITLLRAIETPYQVVQTDLGTEVINHFRLRVKNQWNEPIKAKVELDPQFGELILPQNAIELSPLELKTVHFFVKFQPEAKLATENPATLSIQNLTTSETPIKLNLELLKPDNF